MTLPAVSHTAELYVCYRCDQPARECAAHPPYQFCGCFPCALCVDPDLSERRASMEILCGHVWALGDLATRYGEPSGSRAALRGALAEMRRLAERIGEALAEEPTP